MKKALLVFVSMVFALPSFAQNQWIYNAKIEKVRGITNGGFLLYLDKTKSECTQAGTNAFYFYPDRNNQTIDGLNAQLSIALVAFTTERLIDIIYDPTDPHCWGATVIVK